MMKAKQSQAASLFAAPLAQAARALGALQAKVEADPSASAAAAEAPAPEEVSATDQDADSEQGAKEEDANQEDANPHDSSPTPDAPEADAEPAAEAEETTEGDAHPALGRNDQDAMAKMSTEEMLDAFKEMSLLELSEFVKAFEGPSKSPLPLR